MKKARKKSPAKSKKKSKKNTLRKYQLGQAAPPTLGSSNAYSGFDQGLDYQGFDANFTPTSDPTLASPQRYNDASVMPDGSQVGGGTSAGNIAGSIAGAASGIGSAVMSGMQDTSVDDPQGYFNKSTLDRIERARRGARDSGIASGVGQTMMSIAPSTGVAAPFVLAAGALTTAGGEIGRAVHKGKEKRSIGDYDKLFADRQRHKERQARKKQQNLDRYSNMNYYGAGSGLSRDGGLPKMKSGGPMYMEKYGVGGLSRVHGPTHEQGGIPIAFNSNPQDGGPQIVPEGMAEGEVENREMIDQTDITQEILREGGVKSGTYMFSEHVGVDGKKGKNKKSLSYADARGKVEKMNLPRDMKKNVIRDLMNGQAEDTNKPERFGGADKMSSTIDYTDVNKLAYPSKENRQGFIKDASEYLEKLFLGKEKEPKIVADFDGNDFVNEDGSVREMEKDAYSNVRKVYPPSGKSTVYQTPTGYQRLEQTLDRAIANSTPLKYFDKGAKFLFGSTAGIKQDLRFPSNYPSNFKNRDGGLMKYQQAGLRKVPDTEVVGGDLSAKNAIKRLYYGAIDPKGKSNVGSQLLRLAPHTLIANTAQEVTNKYLAQPYFNLTNNEKQIQKEAERQAIIADQNKQLEEYKKLLKSEGLKPLFKNGGLPKYQSGSYTVQSGDTLSGIAQAQGIADYNEIYNLNKALIGADPGRIQPGQVLTMPGAASTSTPAATSAWSSAPMPFTKGTGPLGASPLSGYPGFGAGTLTGSGKRPAKPPVKDKSTGEFNKYAPYGIAALGAAGQIATIAAINAKEGVDPANVASISPPDQIYLPSVKDPTKGGRESDRRAMLRDINTGTGPGKAGRYQQARIGLMREEEKMALGINKLNADIRQAEAFKNAQRKDTTAYKNAEIAYKNAVSARNEALRLLESKTNKLKAYGDVARGMAKDTLEYYAMEEQAKAAAGDTGVMNRFYANNYEKFAKKYQKENPGASAQDTYVAFTSQV